MFRFLFRLGRVVVASAVAIAATTIFGVNTLPSAPIPVAAVHTAATCTATPSAVALDQSFTISASGLPNSQVNLVRKYPNGNSEIMPITVSSGGTFTLTQSSADSVLPSEQTGTYTYLFVSKVKWPAGTYSQTYATCSVSVG
ncbi:hypothetical protein EPN29_02730 [bacterium]|nr:MAG: hypothetical protein EPN29_02730 [bacterium]